MTVTTLPAGALDRLIRDVERKVPDSMLAICRPRRGHWHATLFRDHDDPTFQVYESGSGDTLTDALTNLLAQPGVQRAHH